MTRNFLGEYRIFTQKTSTMLLKIGKLELANRLHSVRLGGREPRIPLGD